MLKKIFDELPWFRKIAVLRAAKGLGQREAANLCLISDKSYWEWENGKSYPRLASRKAIADAYGLKVGDIFSDKDELVTD